MLRVRFHSRIERFNSNLWAFHIPVPEEAFSPFIASKKKRIVCTVENQVKFHAALMPDGKKGWFININKENRNILGLIEGQAVAVEIEEDTSEFGMPVCEEFQEMLKQDDEAVDYFKKLTPGKQRNLIHFTGSVKSSHIRLRRSFVVCEHLKNYKGSLDFKKLYQELKEANQAGW